MKDKSFLSVHLDPSFQIVPALWILYLLLALRVPCFNPIPLIAELEFEPSNLFERAGALELGGLELLVGLCQLLSQVFIPGLLLQK